MMNIIWKFLLSISFIRYSKALKLKSDDGSNSLSFDLTEHLDNVLSKLASEPLKKKVFKKRSSKLTPKKFKFLEKKSRFAINNYNKTDTEACVNLANMDNNRPSDLLSKDATSSYFQESLINSLDTALTAISTEQENELKAEQIRRGKGFIILEKRLSEQRKKAKLNVTKKLEVKETDTVKTELYDFMKEFEIIPVFNSIQVSFDPKEKLNVKDLNKVLKLFSSSTSKVNQYQTWAPKLFIDLSQNLEKNFTSVYLKKLAQYLLDFDFVLTVTEKIPEFKNLEISYQIYVQILNFIEKFFTNENIEIIDPEFANYFKLSLDRYHEIHAESKDPVPKLLLEIIKDIKSMTFQRLMTIKLFMENPIQYYKRESTYSLRIYPLLEYKYGDMQLTVNLGEEEIRDLHEKNKNGYMAECSLGEVLGDYQFGAYPVLEYTHPNFHTHYYTTDFHELGANKKNMVEIDNN